MNLDDELTKEQIEIIKAKNIKNPTITKILELADELDIEARALTKYFIEKQLS